jgi:starch synthase
MESKRILYVSQEIHPYLPENEISRPSLEMPKKMNEKGHQVRVFMPRFGLINERRHQLHEVIRLSGINVIVNDMDQPLIIKVASVPQARMQVYFIDNEEYFKRKALFTDENDQLYGDNDQRALFFCRGVIETVRKLSWSPDIIHCHGWMASFLPLYIKRFFADDPLFSNTKTVLSLYKSPEGPVGNNLIDTLKFDGVKGKDLEAYKENTIPSALKAAMAFTDGVVNGSPDTQPELLAHAQKEVPHFLDLSPSDKQAADVHALYEQIAVEESVA